MIILVYGKLKSAYVEKWEQTRREQNVLACDALENVYKNTITATLEKILLENRAHEELEKYLNQSKDVSMKTQVKSPLVNQWEILVNKRINTRITYRGDTKYILMKGYSEYKYLPG